MAGNKKKKKPAANPARGFATTSITSKPRVEIPEDSSLKTSNSGSKVPTGTTTPEEKSAQKVASAPGALDARELKDLTPEELEAQLEESELQQFVERNASKVRRDAVRQYSRLETEKRLLRGQAEYLSTVSWFPEEVVLRIGQILRESEIQTTSITASRSMRPALSEEVLLVNLWTLRLVLQDMVLPQVLVEKAMSYVLSCQTRGIDDNSGLVWGLSEVLEWLAVTSSDGSFDEYDVQKSATSQDTSESETLITRHIQRIEDQKKSTAFGKKGCGKSTTNGSATTAPEKPDIILSDSESDSDPDEMLSKYIQYKLRLYDHDPEVFGGLQMAGKKDSQSSYTPGESRLLQRMSRMESDPLFDKQTADFTWREKRAEALQHQAEQRRLGISKGINHTNRPAKDCAVSAADKAKTEAEAIATDILQLENEDDDNGLFEGMFELPVDTTDTTLQSQSQSTQTSHSATVILRTFAQIDGYSPRRLLEDACKAKDPNCRVTLNMISDTTYSCRHSVLVQWSKDQEVRDAPFLTGLNSQSTKRAVLIEMIRIAASGIEQSEGFACTAAFFVIFAGSPKDDKAALRLPPSFRDLYQEFSAAKQAFSDEMDRKVLQNIRQSVEAHKANQEEEDVVLKSAFRNRGKQSSGTSTPDSSAGSYNADAPRADLQSLWTKKTQMPSYQSMLVGRMDLPMYRFRDQALEAVSQNQVTILCGETGCGKSTQMPAFILENQMSQGIPCRIYCTEPRRISAVSLAQRVSEELGEEKNAVGTARSLVGYAIRLESHAVSSTRLIYATVGIVLRMLESQHGLKDLTHLIIDEVHERSIDTDFLLIVLKSLLIQRPDLKVILMSATVDATRFSRYLGNAPIITVPGRTFPVRDLYLEDAIEMTGYKIEDGQSGRADNTEVEDDDVDQASGPLDTQALGAYKKSTIKTLSNFDEYRIDYVLIVKLLELLATDSKLDQFNKAVLIFLPGIAEIRQLTDMLAGHPMFRDGWLLYPLHSTFSNEEQQAAFKVPPPGMRKIVLATNIAETGITIPDVTCVIDTGKHKEMRFDEKRQLSRLIQSFISRANAKQRRGRAGRVQEGICFHLFTKQRHDKMMTDQQLPEMLRLSLQNLVIRVKICKLGDIEGALSQALDPPLVKNIRRAIDALIEVGAFTGSEELTAMGQQIARLPLDAQLGKLVLLGSQFGCLDFALTTAAIASSKSPFLTPMNAKRQADTVRLGFKRGDSDLLTVFNAYQTWRRICTSPGLSEFEFCKRNFLSQQNLSNIEELKGQLLSSLADTGLVSLSYDDRSALSRIRQSKLKRNFISVPSSASRNEDNDSLISSVVAWSFYPRILVRDGKGWRSVANNQSLSLHPTSVNMLSASPGFEKIKYLSFYSIMQSSSRFTNAQETTPVEAMALVLLAGDARFDFYSGVIVIDGNRLRFKVRTWRDMMMLKTLRTKVKGILAKDWKRPGREMTNGEREWFEILLDMFRAWDERKSKEKP